MGRARPAGVTALAVFFALGALAAGVSAASIAGPGGPLEPMWRLNPRARDAFESMGGWSIALLAVVSAACAFAARGLWRLERRGRRLAIGLIAVNLAADVFNAVSGFERRAAAGIPVAAAILAYLLSRRVREVFERPDAAAPVTD